MKESEVSTDNADILLPQGVSTTYFKDKDFHKALPTGFWPVAIREDSVGSILLNKLDEDCPQLHEYIEDDISQGLLGQLANNTIVQYEFNVLMRSLRKDISMAKINTSVTFMDFE